MQHVKYRYILAHVITGEILGMLPLANVRYTTGMYRGTEMSGNAYIPQSTVDIIGMQGPYWSVRNPDSRGVALSDLLVPGRVAIFVVRNRTVVWGGILWTVNYSSEDREVSLTANSYDSYIFYRTLRRTVMPEVIKVDGVDNVNQYNFARTVLERTFNDFTEVPTGDPSTDAWTGNTSPPPYGQGGGVWPTVWPRNAGVGITLPPVDSNKDNLRPITDTMDAYRGSSLSTVGDLLVAWADVSAETGGSQTVGGFEFRVVCGYDEATGRFTKRYQFGRGTSNWLGKSRTESDVIIQYPEAVRSYTMAMSMEEGATRVIVSGDGDGANKIAVYAANTTMLAMTLPGGERDWPLYDRVESMPGAGTPGNTDALNPGLMIQRARRLLLDHKPPDDRSVGTEVPLTGVATHEFTATLRGGEYPVFGSWDVGDWVQFAISDEVFYGKDRVLPRRIMEYTVQVTNNQDMDDSAEEEVILVLGNKDRDRSLTSPRDLP